MKLSIFILFLFVTVSSLTSAKKSKHCRHRPRQQPGQQHLIGKLRYRPDFLHGVALDSKIAAQAQKEDGTLKCLKPNTDLGVPTYEMKWDPIERDGPGKWDFKETDEIASWLRGHHKGFRGHNGVWSQSTPDWVKQLDGPSHKEALKKALYDHVYGVVKRYGKQMIAFDVINEPLEGDSSGQMKNDVFFRNLGYDMFVIAFQAAHRAKWELKSNVKLYINEFGIEDHINDSKKLQSMLNLVDKLKELKVDVEGIGMQFHRTVYDFPKDAEHAMKLFTDRGLEVSVTELDIRKRDNDNSEETLNKQAWQYAAVYETCLKNKACKIVVRWGVDDDHSWVPSYFPGWGSASMFGSKCQVKPKIFKAVAQVLAKY